jgi:hypothetical protein
MARFLKQSTAFTFRIGPFVDSADGVTPETGLAIGQADIQISKAGGAFAQTSASPTTTHDADGWYQCPLTTTDTGTLGTLTVQIVMAGALPVWEHFMVLPANVYDSLVGGTDVLDVSVTQWLGTAAATPTVAGVPEVDITHISGSAVSTSTAQLGVNAVQISGDSTAADNLETAFDDTAGAVPWMGIVDQGTAQSASSTGVVLRSAAAFADDTLIGCIIGVFGSTQGYWQFREITDNALSGDAVTVDTWTVTPSGTITYKIFGGAPASASLLPPVNVTQFGGVAGTFSGGRPEVNTTLIEGSDATNQIRDAVVDDATRIDASALNTLSSHDPGETIMGATDLGTGSGLTSLATAAELAKVPKSDSTVTWNATALASINTQVDTALADYDGPTNAEMVARTLATADYATAANLATLAGYVDTEVAAIKAVTDKLDDTLEDSGGGAYIFTEPALAQAPSGTGASAQSIVEAMFQNDTGETAATAVPGSAIYEIVENAGGGGGLDAAGVRAAIGMASANLDTQLSGIQTDTNDIQTRIPAALVSGRIDATVGAMQANVMTAAAAAADLTTELQSGLATAAALTTVEGKIDTVDTVVDAIQAKTDALPSDPADASVIAARFDTLDTSVAGVQSDTNDIQTRLPAALTGGRMDVSVGAMQADVLTGTALAASAVTEIQSGLATAAALTTVDTVVDAIQAKTDSLAFTSGRVHADTKAVAGVVLQQNGSGTQSIGGP